MGEMALPPSEHANSQKLVLIHSLEVALLCVPIPNRHSHLPCWVAAGSRSKKRARRARLVLVPDHQVQAL